jgi:hypothetical protein
LFKDLSFLKFPLSQIPGLITAFIYIKKFHKRYLKTFAVYGIGYYSFILFHQQGWSMVLSFLNRQFTCIAVERFSTKCRPAAKRIHSGNVKRLILTIITTRKYHISNCISEVPASNSYRRLPDFSERFSYRDATPKSSSTKVQDKVEFHFTFDDVYYTIIITLSNIPFMLRSRRTSCSMSRSHNTDFAQSVVRRCR